METFFTLAKSNSNIKPLEIFNFKYLITSYADDTTFFLKDLNSAKIIFQIFDKFSKFSGLKVNKSKCQIAGIGVKNGAQEALSGVQSVDLSTDSIKILGVNFTYNGDILLKKISVMLLKKLKKYSPHGDGDI